MRNSRSILPSHKPSVVVLPPDAFVVDRQHRPDLCIWQSSPFVRDWVIDLAVFTDNRRGIRSTDSEDSSIRQGRRRLIAPWCDHVRPFGEGIASRVIETCHIGVAASSDQEAPVLETAHSRAEHVVASIGDCPG